MTAAVKKKTIYTPSARHFKVETVGLIEDWVSKESFWSQKWISDLRESGWQNFKKQGIPISRLERFKWSDVYKAVKNLDLKFGLTHILFSESPYCKTLQDYIDQDGFEDWIVKKASEAPAGEKIYGDMALWHLANAFYGDGFVVDIPADTKPDKPIEVKINAQDGTFFVPRTLYRLQKGAEATIIEYHTGEGAFWNNRVTQIMVEEGAILHHHRVQQYGAEAVYTQNTSVDLAERGQYHHANITSGAAFSRAQLHIDMMGEGAEANISGATVINGNQLADKTVTVHHHAPHCASHQTFRTVLDDKAQGVFQGKVTVDQAAQKTDAQQDSRALMLSDRAQMNAKPELEIYADDVKCAHGATTGQMNEDQLFYMRQRGLNQSRAQRLLIGSFLSEALSTIQNEDLKHDFETTLSDLI